MKVWARVRARVRARVSARVRVGVAPDLVDEVGPEEVALLCDAGALGGGAESVEDVVLLLGLEEAGDVAW